MDELKDKIIVALDVDTEEEVKALVETLGSQVGCFKIGLQLITSIGPPRAIQLVKDCGGEVFFDGKFDDIPNTVGNASRVLAEFGVKMFNVHASCGIAAMMEAVDNKGNALVLAVTVLTSLEENNAHLIFGKPSKAAVLQFARDAKNAGMDGVICSPQELELLGQQPDLKDFLKVTPGVRPVWAATGDQRRTMTPGEAMKAGATALVIGRPVRQPPEEIGGPVEAVKRILDEIAGYV